jgi:hypothetical protein
MPPLLTLTAPENLSDSLKSLVCCGVSPDVYYFGSGECGSWTNNSGVVRCASNAGEQTFICNMLH